MNLQNNKGHLGFLFETVKGNRLQTYSENTWEKRWEWIGVSYLSGVVSQ